MSNDRTYTARQFRKVLDDVYGTGPDVTDWELAGLAAPDFNVKRLTVYRWLIGQRPIIGTAAAATYLLSTRPK